MDLLGKIFKKPNPNSIFVQIASYRDPEVIPTIRDLLTKSTHPQNLRIVVLNEWHKEDNIDFTEFKDDSRIKIISSKYNESQGIGWARNHLNNEYSNQKYTLQISSNHRFTSGWDVELISMLEDLIKKGNQKPILTTYTPEYVLGKSQEDWDNTPYKIVHSNFNPNGSIITSPLKIDIQEELSTPTPTQFISSHFIFTLGRFCVDVIYDPSIQSPDEEITMAVRAFTNGYRMFTPNKVILWQGIPQTNTPKFSKDYKNYEELIFLSNDRTKKLLEIDGSVCSPCLKKRMKSYFLGNVNSKEEYEEFSGIHFNNRGVTLHTLDHKPPPGPEVEGNFKDQFYPRQYYKITIPKNILPNHLEYDFWAVILLDDNKVEIHRQDIDNYTTKRMMEDGNDTITLGGSYKGRPYTNWIIWPHKDKWLQRLSGTKQD